MKQQTSAVENITESKQTVNKHKPRLLDRSHNTPYTNTPNSPSLDSSNGRETTTRYANTNALFIWWKEQSLYLGLDVFNLCFNKLEARFTVLVMTTVLVFQLTELCHHKLFESREGVLIRSSMCFWF